MRSGSTSARTFDPRGVGRDDHRLNRAEGIDEALGGEESDREILERLRQATGPHEEPAAQHERDDRFLDDRVLGRPGPDPPDADRPLYGHGSILTAQTLNSGILATGSSAAIVRRLAGASR